LELARILVDSLVRFSEDHWPTEEQLERIETVEEVEALEHQLQAEWAAIPIPALGGQTPTAYLATAPGEEWVRFLTDWAGLTHKPSSLPKPLRQIIESRKAELGPLLSEMVRNQSLWDADSPGAGYASVMAAVLLGELREERAVDALLHVIETAEELTVLGDEALAALAKIGEPAREGLYALAAKYEGDVDSIPFLRAMDVLTQLPRAERTWQLLRGALQRSKEMVGFYAAIAGDYGDQRALFHLNTLLEEREDLSADDRRDCLESIQLLGGAPTARAREMLVLDAAKRVLGYPPHRKVGRNDPCPCGSGKKYKKCHGQ
jgi:hypothetical protein